ncbi:glycoside hydrolase family 55 protein [Paenibacillus sp. CC-CFT747]|nr:glycoside hydrolase family 55 protein [Paenibacillus sp. CC-CFT747]
MASYQHVNSSFADVKQFGAAGNGAVDDTESVRLALASIPDGGTVYFPPGTYRITRSIEILSDKVCLCGQGSGSHLLYTYEQQDGDIPLTASLFVFREGIRNVTIRDLRLEYAGFFYSECGQSYLGKVDALRFRQCFDVSIENIEASGFNASAITVSTGDASKYAKRFHVHKCYLHHNRVAGVLFGNVERLSIMDCDLEYQGSPPDGGTGYGCAGFSGSFPVISKLSATGLASITEKALICMQESGRSSKGIYVMGIASMESIRRERGRATSLSGAI